MNILVCESKQELLGSHITRLQKVFYPSTFDYAENGKEAMEKIESYGHSYDLILSRGELEQASGLELYEWAREKDCSIPFFLCSDFQDTSCIEKLNKIEDPDLFCLNVPYDSQDLKQVIDLISFNACQ